MSFKEVMQEFEEKAAKSESATCAELRDQIRTKDAQIASLRRDLTKVESKSAEDIAAQIADIKDRKKKAKTKDNDEPENDADYMLIIAFDNRAQKETFLRSRNYATDVKFLAAAAPRMKACGLMRLSTSKNYHVVWCADAPDGS